MPRKTPIPAIDRKIALRIGELRRQCKCTQAFLANRIGITPAEIQRVELYRVPLKYDLARGLFNCLGVNPGWAATGRGNPNGYVQLPSHFELNVPRDSVFSDVFFKHLASLFDDNKANPKSEIILRYQRAKVNAKIIEMRFQDVPDGHIGELEKALEKAWEEVLSKCPKEDPKRVLQRRLWYKDFVQRLQGKQNRMPWETHFLYLTVPASYGIPSAVNQQMPGLLDRLKKATNETGKMSALAKYLSKATRRKVPLESVSRWLAGAREPGGEITLLMQQWVTDQESQK